MTFKKFLSATLKTARTTQCGGNAYQNETVRLLHVTRPVHATVPTPDK